MPSHCGVEARLEARPVLSRFICPICGAWRYVNAEKPEQWVDDHFVDPNKMPTVKESLTVQPELFEGERYRHA